ncbi:hypothetical protein [Kyrpidia sp.]|uniref:hypothetical protein n=1 Tax=Kyrpidia sp. TaxID=2073077 RepID=UPI0025881375|nr:hypothetical protein [Kyrpidia sp.]MCL6576903.1 hypothetical protein [Kyrpidia sp.]
MPDKLDLILQKLDSIESKVSMMDERLLHVESIQKQHGDMITQLIGIVESTNQKVSDMQTDISALIEGQKRQDKIIESLALRSLEQETELREIKRAK